MTIENLAQGIKILTEHGATGYCLAAEHDIIYVADASKVKMKLSVARELYKLGFFIDEESWALFT